MTAAMLVVGAGQAGLQAAESLRAEGWDGEILLIGDEAAPPYHRPPLSKDALTGAEGVDLEKLTIRGPDALEKKRITLLTGVRVAAIDRAGKQISLADGRTIAYHGLCLATGARPRPLPVPGGDLPGILALRSIEDARQLAAGLESARSVAVIGGGFIGLEVAAAARKRGLPVTIIEMAPRLMARVVAPVVSEVFLDLHREHGAEILLSTGVAGIVDRNGRAAGVNLSDGREIEADLLVAGIGVIANDQLAKESGLACDNGIVVDRCGRTADPCVVAAGDNTATRLAPDLPLRRLESVQNAVEQAKAAAAALMGQEKPFAAAPWFWSDQYDVKLQMVGLSSGHDRVVTRGDVAGRNFSAFYFAGDRLLAIDSLNRPADHMAGRKLLDRGIALTPEQAADETVNLSALAKG